MRYFAYLLIYFVVQMVTYLITPILPLFKTARGGWCNNREKWLVDWRLPRWLAWFDTPDNSIDGDRNFYDSHGPGYLSRVIWLYRNSLYGFKWTVLAAPSPAGMLITGDKKVLDYHTGQYGIMHLKASRYWQWKCVKPFGKWILVLNFGWLLEDTSQEKALFMFSPRIKRLLK